MVLHLNLTSKGKFFPILFLFFFFVFFFIVIKFHFLIIFFFLNFINHKLTCSIKVFVQLIWLRINLRIVTFRSQSETRVLVIMVILVLDIKLRRLIHFFIILFNRRTLLMQTIFIRIIWIINLITLRALKAWTRRRLHFERSGVYQRFWTWGNSWVTLDLLLLVLLIYWRMMVAFGLVLLLLLGWKWLPWR